MVDVVDQDDFDTLNDEVTDLRNNFKDFVEAVCHILDSINDGTQNGAQQLIIGKKINDLRDFQNV